MLPYVALSLGSLLVLSATFAYSPTNAQVNLNTIGTPTLLTLDDVPAKMRIGDNVTLTGALTTVDGNIVDHASVSVYLLTPEPRLILLGSGFTDTDGRYEVTWQVHVIATNKVSNDVTTKISMQVFDVFAQFDGNDTYAPSKSGKRAASIEPNIIKVYINADKNAYQVGETALVFLAFIDLDEKFVDPDSMKADFAYVNQSSTSTSLQTNPHISINDQLQKKKVGSYTYITPPLKAGHNQIMVIPTKTDYDIDPATITIIVIRGAGSAGRF